MTKAVAKTANEAILETFENRRRSEFNLGEGKCLMASSCTSRISEMLKKLGHSFFTYYLLEGLKEVKVNPLIMKVMLHQPHSVTILMIRL